MILPLERTRTIYAGLNRDELKIFKEGRNLFEPVIKVMKDLPSDVSPDSPVNPKNDVFTVIPAGGTVPRAPGGFVRRVVALRRTLDRHSDYE